MLKENLREYRRQAGLTQRQVAQQVGVGVSTISMYEQGQRLPDVDTLSKLSKVLGVSVNALLSDAPQELDDILDTMKENFLLEGGVMFKGMPLSEEEVDAVVEAMKIGARIALRKKGDTI